MLGADSKVGVHLPGLSTPGVSHDVEAQRGGALMLKATVARMRHGPPESA